MSDLEEALYDAGNSAPGLDDIHYEMLHRLHLGFVLGFCQKLYNEIWTSNFFPAL